MEDSEYSGSQYNVAFILFYINMLNLLLLSFIKAYFFYCMEYLNGGTLDWHLKQLEVFTKEQTTFYSAQIFSGLLFLHNKQIIHRYIYSHIFLLFLLFYILILKKEI